MTTSLANERTWLERIETSKVVGICVLDEQGRLVQRFDDDPQLRDAMAEHQRQRIREMELAVEAVAPVLAEIFSPDGSGGQAGDDASFADGMSRIARTAPSPFTRNNPSDSNG